MGSAALTFSPSSAQVPNGTGSPGANGGDGGNGGVTLGGSGGNAAGGTGQAGTDAGVGGAGGSAADGTAGGAGGAVGRIGLGDTGGSTIFARPGRAGTRGSGGGGGGAGWLVTGGTSADLNANGAIGGNGGNGSCVNDVCGGGGGGGVGLVIRDMPGRVTVEGFNSVGGGGGFAVGNGGAGGGGVGAYVDNSPQVLFSEASILGGDGGDGGGDGGAAIVIGSNSNIIQRHANSQGITDIAAGSRVEPGGAKTGPVADAIVFQGNNSRLSVEGGRIFAGNGTSQGTGARFIGNGNRLSITSRDDGTGGYMITTPGPADVPAIVMGGTDNTLEFRGTGHMEGGYLQSTRGNRNTLALGGTRIWDQYTPQLDVSTVDDTSGQFRGLDYVSKLENGSWTLTGRQGSDAEWQVKDGTLVLTGDADIGSARRVTVGMDDTPAGQPNVVVDGVDGSSASFASLAGNSTGVIRSLTAPKKIRITNGLGDAYGGDIRTAGGLEVSGGRQVFTGDLTYTGGTQVTGGVMQLGDGGAGGTFRGNAVIAPGAALAIHKSGTYPFGQVISGAGSLHQMGPGNTVLLTPQTFTGGTTITGGTLQIHNAGTDPAGSLASGVNTGQDAVNRGILDFNQSAATYTFAHNISGTGSVLKNGPGTVELSGDNTHTGGTRIVAGTLQIGAGGATGSLTGDVDNEGVLVFNRTGTLTYAGNVTGSGALLQAGTGTTILTGNSEQSGGTTISAGTLQVGDGGTAGSIDGNVVNNGELAVNRSDTYTIDGDITGTGGLRQSGAGTTVLTGNNSYTGETTIQAGTLQAGAGGTHGAVAGNVNVAPGAIFAVNRSNAYTVAGTLSGGGTFDQRGTGTTGVINDSAGFAGNTRVSSGTLLVDAALGSAASTLTVANGGTLQGTGTVGGNATIDAGGRLVGYQNETLRFGGDLTLNPGAEVHAWLGRPTPTDVGLFNVANNLTLAGTLNVHEFGGFGPGVSRIFDYGGALADNGFALGALPGSVSPTDVAISYATPGQVNLVNSAGVALDYWDGGNPANHGNGVVNGGDGTWNNADTNWTDDSGTQIGPWAADHFAVFQGTGGTVSVDNSAGPVSFDGMQFAVTGYRLQGDALALTNAATTIRVGNGTRPPGAITATIASPLTGTGGLNKTDYGTLVLAADNSYTGGTTISSGTLQLGEGGASGSIAGNVVNNGTLAFNRSGTFTFAGTVSGTGHLLQAGPGTTILTANNTSGGGTTIAAGTLQLGDGGTTGAITGGVANQGTLAINRSDTVTFDGRIDGTGALHQLGTGTTVLTANNTYSGATTISGGTLQLGNGGRSGTVAGPIATAAGTTLAINRADNFVLPGQISGAGRLLQTGPGTTVLTGDATHTGGTVISAGAVQLGNGGASGGLAGNVSVASGAALRFQRADTYNFGGSIDGAGGVVQAGSGTTVLNGANSYSGQTVVAQGTLRQGTAGAFSPNSSYAVQSHGALEIGGFNQSIAALNNDGVVRVGGSGAGTELRVAGDYTGHGTVVLNTTLNQGGPLANQITDRLLIGGNATGSTALQLNVSGEGANTNVALDNREHSNEGISLVQVSGTSSPGAFVLSGGYVAAPNSPYQYRVFAYGPGQTDETQSLLPNGTQWDYRLSTAYLDDNGNPIPGVPPTPAPPGPPTPNRKALVPAGSSLLVAGQALREYGATMVDGLHRRLGDIQHDDLTSKRDAPEVFARAIGKTGQYRTSKDWQDYGFDFKQDISAVQVGGNWLHVPGRDSDLRLGAAATFGSTRFYPKAPQIEDSRTRVDAQSIALTATWQNAEGWYVDGVAALTHYDGKVTASMGRGAGLNARGADISVETGKPYRLRNGIELEPQAQLLGQALKIDRTSTGDKVEFSQGSSYALTARLGVRATFPLTATPMWRPYVRMDVLHTWSGAPSVKLGGERFGPESNNSALRVGLGASGQITERLQVWGEADAQQRLGGHGMSSIGGTLGVRYAF